MKDKYMLRKNTLRKKSQAALEFLTTYGWAIMIILVAIGALSYFGFTNPQKILPDKCIFGNGIVCQDSLITSASVHASVYNGLGKTIYNLKASSNGFDATCTVTPDNFASSDTPIKIDCALPIRYTIGEKKKLKLFLNYTRTPSGYNQVSNGEIYSTVQ